MEAALKHLRGDADFIFLHIEASDEAGHEGEVMLKKKTIEAFDSRVVTPILKGIEAMKEDVAIAVLPDHPTPCSMRTHTSKPVPFIIYKNGIAPDKVKNYSEKAATEGGYGLLSGDEFIREFLR